MNVPHLVAPTVAVHASYLDALAEFGPEPPYATLSMDGLAAPDAFARFVRQLIDDALPDSHRPPGRVPSTVLWWAEGSEYLGQVVIRHTLDTEYLAVYGGHIGYDVRPSVRRQGHATRMLAAALPVAAALGIDPALVTCDATNVASRRVIERNGGMFSDQRDAKLRYWVPTQPRHAAAGH